MEEKLTAQTVTGASDSGALDRRTVLKAGALSIGASILKWARLLPDDAIFGQEGKAVQPKGALSLLAKELGGRSDLSIIVWDPSSIGGLPGFFDRAVQAGVTRVWVSGFRFNQMDNARQKAFFNQARVSGLRSIGFIDGNYDWANNPAFVKSHYEKLIVTLTQFHNDKLLGRLKIVFAADIEPWTGPNGKNWNGDFKPSTDLVCNCVIPEISGFAQRTGRVDRTNLITLVMPFWSQNGTKLDNDLVVKGVEDLPNTTLALMSYRNSALEIESVLNDTRSRLRTTPARDLRWAFGGETLPPGEVGGQHVTFHGRLKRVPLELLRVIRRLSESERKQLDEVFIHFASPVAADKAIKEWLESPAEEPAKGKDFSVRGGQAKISKDGSRLEFQMDLGDLADQSLVAVALVRTDTWYPQPYDNASAQVPVQVDKDGVGNVVVFAADRSSFVGEQTKGRAVIILTPTDFQAVVKDRLNPARLELRAQKIIVFDKEGKASVVNRLPRGGLEESIRLPAHATDERVIILTPDTAVVGLELLRGFRPEAGEKIPVAVIVRNAVQHSQLLDLLEAQSIQLQFPVVDLSETGQNLGEAIVALQEDAWIASLNPLVIDTMAAFRQLGTFLGIPELDQRLLDKWLDEQGVASAA